MSNELFDTKMKAEYGLSTGEYKLNDYIVDLYNKGKKDWNTNDIKTRSEILSKKAINELWEVPKETEKNKELMDKILKIQKNKNMIKSFEEFEQQQEDEISEEQEDIFTELDKRILELYGNSEIKNNSTEYLDSYIKYNSKIKEEKGIISVSFKNKKTSLTIGLKIQLEEIGLPIQDKKIQYGKVICYFKDHNIYKHVLGTACLRDVTLSNIDDAMYFIEKTFNKYN